MTKIRTLYEIIAEKDPSESIEDLKAKLAKYEALGTPEEIEEMKKDLVAYKDGCADLIKRYSNKEIEKTVEKAKEYDEMQKGLAEAKKRLDNYKEPDYGPIDNTNDASAKTDIKDSAIQLLGLNIEFEKENTVEQISQKTYLTITAAEFIKDKYDQLVKTGIDLYQDSIAEDGKKIPVYRPNAARVLIREKEWMNEFFTKFLVRDSFKEPEAKKLLDLYNTRLWEAVQEQLKQFFVNLPEFRALSDLHKQDLEKCVKNSPDNGGSEILWNGLKYLESLESALEAERHRCESYFNSIWGL